MEQIINRPQIVYSSMKFFYFYNRPDFQLVWDFINNPMDVLKTIPIRIPHLDNLLLKLHKLMKEYTDQFDEFEYWDFNDELYCLDCYGNADKDFLKDALEYNLAVIFATMRQGIVLREDYFKLAMSHLFFLLRPEINPPLL